MTQAREISSNRAEPASLDAVRREAGAALLPSTEALLGEGGDTRLALDRAGCANRYGCTRRPEAGAAQFASATASTISPGGFDAAGRLRQRLMTLEGREPRPATYARELDRVRAELIDLSGLNDLPGLDVVFAASGTDLHLLVGELFAGSAAAPTLCINIEPEETGSGVPLALEGRHFSTLTALGSPVVEGGPVGAGGTEFATLAARAPDGALRPPAEIEADLDALAHTAAKAGRKILLTVADVSKTGLISPGLDVVLALRRRFPRAVEVLIDACQFRLSAASLRAYLDHGFLVAVTGSKFLTGPTFSAALLAPEPVSAHLRGRLLRPGLRAYSARAEWPVDWTARATLADAANFGLLLRWEAALSELRAFRAIPEDDVQTFVAAFAGAVQDRLAGDRVLAALPVRVPDRTAIGAGDGWDRLPTIFPFLMRHTGSAHGGYLSLAASQDVYRSLMGAASPVRLGQPVLCGWRHGRPISALRLCNSARLIVEGAADGGARSAAVIGRAMSALDAAAAAARAMSATGRV